jgi:hypothetical protein
MGIKASPTCVMNYDGAVGYLVGEANHGLACMFTMMNDARFQVGLEGLGTAERAYQGARQYALERLQSRAPEQPLLPEQKADPIIAQPDVKRMLLTQKSLAEGARALSLWYAKLMDIEKYGHGDEALQASQAIAYLTPITKAFFTDIGTEAAHLGIQVLGGHGYIREWGMEQLLRDNRVAQIYEGTNGIQAADLIGRKLTRSQGQYLHATHTLLNELSDGIQDTELRSRAQLSLRVLLSISEHVSAHSGEEVAAMAHDYLQCVSYHIVGVLWCSVMDSVTTHPNQQYIDNKRKTGLFYLDYVLPRADMHQQCLASASVINRMTVDDFIGD